ncbi:MAG: acyl-CoA dehydrogenase family protein, partial [Woeseiaceae bacterium]|nr:acyl-CoA dehydrogenase family protein [Woeseiaceae bacterium]
MNSKLDPMDLYDIRSELSEDEAMVKDSVGRYVDEKVIPLMRDAFEQHKFPRQLIGEVAELGLLGSSIEGYDCAGLNSVSYGLICQELERGDSGLRSFVSVQSSLVMFPIHTYGSEEQKQRWLPAMARGEAIGCFGLTEPHGGSDPSNMKTHAKRDGDDWILNGSKMWITNATIADVAIVWVRTEEGVKGFIVEKDMPGFDTQEIENKFSLRASVTGALFFNNVRIPEANVLPGISSLR